MKNVNLPPILVAVNNKYLTGDTGFEWGHLISVRALQNQAYQFNVLLSSGALFTGLPLNALGTKEAPELPLSNVQPFDAIDSSIELVTFDTLKYTPCTVKTFSGSLMSGRYLFTLDSVGEGLSRHPIQWKQMHFIETTEGHLLAYPQYRIQFKDNSLCENCNKPLPKYKINDNIWVSEGI